ncbi:transglycosylase SLT domain-containing protein [Alkalihalobacillus sp. NPDC127517]
MTKRGGAQIGNSLKTIFARQKMDGVTSQLEQLGISAYTASGDIRNTMDVWDDIAVKWDSLNNLQRSQLAEQMAGKYHINSMLSLFNNYDKVMQNVETSVSSYGSAEKELELFQEGLEFKISQAVAAFERLSYVIGESGLLKVMILLVDMFANTVNGMADITEMTNGLNLILPLAAVGVYGLVKAGNLLAVTLNTVGKAGTFAKVSLGWLGAGLIGIQLITSSLLGTANAAKANSEAFIQNAQSYKGTSDEVERLKKKHDELIASGDKSKETQGELEETLKAIHAINPQLVDSTGKYGEQMELNADATNRYVESLKAMTDAELESARLVANASRVAAIGDLAEAQNEYDKFDRKTEETFNKLGEIEKRFDKNGIANVSKTIDDEIEEILKSLDKARKAETPDMIDIQGLQNEVYELEQIKKQYVELSAEKDIADFASAAQRKQESEQLIDSINEQVDTIDQMIAGTYKAIPPTGELGEEMEELGDQLDYAGEAGEKQVTALDRVLEKYDELTPVMSSLNGLLDDLAAGKNISATAAANLSKEIPGLVKHMKEENGQVKINEQGIELLRKANMKAYEDIIEAEKQSLINRQRTNKEKLKSYGIEVKAIQTVAEAHEELAKLEDDRVKAAQFADYMPPEHQQQAQERVKAYSEGVKGLRDFASEMAELEAMAGITTSSLQTVGSEIEKQTEAQEGANKETKEAIYLTDEYRNKMARFNLEQSKLNRLKSDYARHSKKYRDSIQKEIDLMNDQKKATSDQIDNLNTQIKTGNYAQTGMQTFTSGGGNSSGSGSGTYNGKYATEINNAAQRHGVDPNLIAAVIQAESSFNPNAKSGAGAQGLMQLMPKTGKAMGLKSPYDPQDNIYAGTKYLKEMLDTFNGNLELGLAAYNYGPTRILNNNNKMPTNKETTNYVKKITAAYSGTGTTSSSGGGGKIAGWDGDITSQYNAQESFRKNLHQGMDLRASIGTPLGTPVAGEVVFAGMGTKGSGYNDYGNAVAVKDSKGDVHVYGHLDRVDVKKGQRVGVGDLVGTTGNTGRSTGPHLHYEIRKNGQLGNTLNPQGVVGQIKSGAISAGSGDSASVVAANQAQYKDNAQNEIVQLEQSLIDFDQRIKELNLEIINSKVAEFDRKKEQTEQRLAEIDLEQSETYDSSEDWIKLQAEREKIIEEQAKYEKEAIDYIYGEIRKNKSLTDAQKSELEDLLVQRNIAMSQIQQQLNEAAFAVIEANLRQFTRRKEQLQNQFDRLEVEINGEIENTEKWIALQLKKENLLREEKQHDEDAIKYLKEQIKNNKNLNASQKEILNGNLNQFTSEYYQKEKELQDLRKRHIEDIVDTYKKALETTRDAGIKVIDDLISAIDKEASDEDYNKRLQKEYDKRQEIMDDIAKLSLDDSMGTQKQVEDLKKQLEEQNMSIEDMQTDRTRELRKDALNEQKDEINNKYDDILNDERKFNEMRQQMLNGSNKAIIKDLESFYKAIVANKSIPTAQRNNAEDALKSAQQYLKDSKPVKMASFKKGGILPMWGSEGRIVEAHEGEAIFPKADTKNLLETIKLNKLIHPKLTEMMNKFAGKDFNSPSTTNNNSTFKFGNIIIQGGSKNDAEQFMNQVFNIAKNKGVKLGY